MIDIVTSSTLTIVAAATPLLFAALGELVVEKSGVLNLGVEGMMVVGAVVAFAVVVQTGSPTLGIFAGAVMGMLLSAVFAFFVLNLFANQIATGLALTIFGLGLSALIGHSYTGQTIDALQAIHIPLLSDIPVLGVVLFGHDPMVYLALIFVVAVTWFLYKSRAGLILRAVGENHHAAHSIGYPVLWIRFGAILFGGFFAGLGGAYLSVVYTPFWVESMVAGRGWIALALVVFAAWKPSRVVVGACIFGGITIIQLHIQSSGVAVPSQLLTMLPYLITIVVLVVISRGAARHSLSAPASLAKSFYVAG